MLEARESALFLPLLVLCKMSLSPYECCLLQPNVEDLKPSTGDYTFLRSACASLCSSRSFLEDLGRGVECISTYSAVDCSIALVTKAKKARAAHLPMQPGPDALRLLASGLVQSGEPLTAIKCLEAICRSPSLKPADNACARLQLAGLIMEYTRSLEQAVLHLNHAVSSQSMLRCDESYDSDQSLQAALAMVSCLGNRQSAQRNLCKPLHGVFTMGPAELMP